MRGSHTIIDLFGWRQLRVGKGANAREREALTALQGVRQPCPGTSLEVWAIALQRHLTEMGRGVTTGLRSTIKASAGRSLPSLLAILGSVRMQLSGLIRMRRVEGAEEDVLGLRLPTLRAVEFDTADYSLLATPF